MLNLKTPRPLKTIGALGPSCWIDRVRFNKACGISHRFTRKNGGELVMCHLLIMCKMCRPWLDSSGNIIELNS